VRKAIKLGLITVVGICLIIALPACKKALTEGPEAHTNPLDPASPDYIAPVNIVIDGLLEADYGSAVASSSDDASSCKAMDLVSLHVVDSADYWNFFVTLETTPSWTAIASDFLSIYLEWIPGGATWGIEDQGGSNSVFNASFDPDAVIQWWVMSGVVQFYTFNQGIPNWSIPPLLSSPSANSSPPPVAPLAGNYEVRVPKSAFGGTKPGSLKVMVFSYNDPGGDLLCADSIPAQGGWSSCTSLAAPLHTSYVTVPALRN